MEAIIGFALLIGALVVFNFVVGMFKNLFSGRPALGLDKLEVRIVADVVTLKDSGTKIPVYNLQMRGPFPLNTGKELMVSVSIFDKDENGKDVAAFSMVPDLIEGPTNAFLQETNLGFVNKGSGFPKWVAVLSIPATFIIPAFGGTRQLEAEVRLFDAADPPGVIGGLVSFSKGDNLQTKASRQPFRTSAPFTHTFEGKGWLEKIRSSDESRKLTIGLALAVAMADGSIDDSEGEAVRAWMKRYLAGIKGSDHDRLRGEFNSALERYYAEAKASQISIESITKQINELGDQAAKYEAVELCYAVMAADGHIETEELKTVREIAGQLKLDAKEVQRIHDGIVTLSDKSLSSGASDHDLLGLEPGWDHERKLAHLRAEFKKWNARLNALQPGAERDQAQEMLEKIGTARAQIRQQS